MSSATFSVVTKFDVGKFGSDFYTVDPKALAASTLADSPDAALDEVDLDLAAGLVDIPGSESDIPLRDIPIELAPPHITDMPLQIESSDMLISVCDSPVGGMETVSSSSDMNQFQKSNCSSPEDSGVDPVVGQPTTKEFDHMYASLARNDNGFLVENCQLREMLVSQLDLIQQQSDSIIQRDKRLKELRVENEQLRMRLMRMERRIKPEDGSKNNAINRAEERSSTPVLTPPKSDSKSKKRSLDRSDKLSKDNNNKKRKVQISEESSSKSLDSSVAAESSSRGGSGEGERLGKRDRWKRLEKRKLLSQETSTRPRKLLSQEASSRPTENQTIAAPPPPPVNKVDRAKDSEVGGASQDIINKVVTGEKEGVNDDLEQPGDRAGKKGAVHKARTPEDTLVNNVIKEEEGSDEVVEDIKEESGQVEEKIERRVPGSVSIGDGDLLHTSYLYHVGCKNEYQTQEELRDVASLQRGVEVPRWRILPEFEATPNKTKFIKSKEVPEWRHKPMHPAYTMEGTENIEDDTILKRHSRHEMDEKRRKRWDIQRMRQQQQFEKLKASEARRGRKEKKGRETDSPISLLPSLEDMTHLMVSDTVPISVFGVPLPNLPHAPFSLPWLDGEVPTAPQRRSGKH